MSDPAALTHHHVLFRVADRELAVAMSDVQEVVRLDRLTPVPGAPAWIEGVLNLRGVIVPALDMRQRLGLPPRVHDPRTCVIVLASDDPVGLVVDAVLDTTPIPPEAITATVDLPPTRCTLVAREAS